MKYLVLCPETQKAKEKVWERLCGAYLTYPQGLNTESEAMRMDMVPYVNWKDKRLQEEIP